MTPEQKSRDLVDKLKQYVDGSVGEETITAYDTIHGKGIRKSLSELCKFSKHYKAKQLALITVDEIILSRPCSPLIDVYKINGGPGYWEQVKLEINKL